MIRRAAAVAVLAAALGAAAFAQSPFLVADINRDAGSGSNPEGYHVVGNRAFFYASTPYHGRELWRTDGTAFGTAMVKEMNPGWGDGICSCGTEIADLNGTVYFVPNDNNLWKTDGTAAGTQLVYRLGAGVANLTSDGKHLFFTTRLGQLWVSDGTAAGTRTLTTTGGGTMRATSIMPGNGITYFTGNAEQYSEPDFLFRTDGSSTTQIKTDLVFGHLPMEFAWAGGAFYLAVRSDMLKVNPGSDTAKTVFSLAPSAPDPPQHLVHAGSGIYFTATSLDGSSIAVQRLDTTTDALSVVLPLSYDAFSLTPVGDKVVILADNPWITDGTQSGTQRLAEDIRPVNYAGQPVAVGGVVYFAAQSQAIPRGPYEGLFRTDGTRAGTTPLFLGIYVRDLTTLGNLLLFSGNNEPWRSDGTSAGTMRIRQLAPTTAASSPDDLTVNGLSLFFTATATNNGWKRLWRTDGYNTAALSNDLTDATIYAPCHGGVLFNGCVGNDCGIFAADGAGRTSLVTRGYAGVDGVGCAGNRAIVRGDTDMFAVDLDRGVSTVLPIMNAANFVSRGGRVFFTVDDNTGSALMQTDGTMAGTSTLVRSETYFSFQQFAIGDVVNGKLVYELDGLNAVPVDGGTPVSLSTRATLDTHINTGSEMIFGTRVDGQDQVWVTDGTPAGTNVLGNIPNYVHAMAASNGKVFILDIFGGLWVTDGTPGNLQRVVDLVDGSTIASANGRVYFTKRDFDRAVTELWVSDGTPAGTYVTGASTLSNYGPLAATDRLLFFTATDPYDGNELWALPIAGQGQPHRHAIR